MKDGTLRPDESLSPADRAVKYLLDRVQNDANLRWHMIGTTAFGLLVEAEAAHTGEPKAAVQQRRWVALDTETPECYLNRKRLEEFAEGGEA